MSNVKLDYKNSGITDKEIMKYKEKVIKIHNEFNENANEYLLLLFKYNMYKVLRFKGQEENAEICLAQAGYIAQKYNIMFEFDTDPNHFIALVDPDEEIIPQDANKYENADINEVLNPESEE